jgi:putrescine aminotransferase
LNSAIVSELYEKHKVLTYFGVNRENPLIISFPLVATKSEVEIAAKSLQEVLDQNIVKLVLKFVTLKMSGPKSNL